MAIPTAFANTLDVSVLEKITNGEINVDDLAKERGILTKDNFEEYFEQWKQKAQEYEKDAFKIFSHDGKYLFLSKYQGYSLEKDNEISEQQSRDALTSSGIDITITNGNLVYPLKNVDNVFNNKVNELVQKRLDYATERINDTFEEAMNELAQRTSTDKAQLLDLFQKTSIEEFVAMAEDFEVMKEFMKEHNRENDSVDINEEHLRTLVISAIEDAIDEKWNNNKVFKFSKEFLGKELINVEEDLQEQITEISENILEEIKKGNQNIQPLIKEQTDKLNKDIEELIEKEAYNAFEDFASTATGEIFADLEDMYPNRAILYEEIDKILMDLARNKPETLINLYENRDYGVFEDSIENISFDKQEIQESIKHTLELAKNDIIESEEYIFVTKHQDVDLEEFVGQEEANEFYLRMINEMTIENDLLNDWLANERTNVKERAFIYLNRVANEVKAKLNNDVDLRGIVRSLVEKEVEAIQKEVLNSILGSFMQEKANFEFKEVVSIDEIVDLTINECDTVNDTYESFIKRYLRQLSFRQSLITQLNAALVDFREKNTEAWLESILVNTNETYDKQKLLTWLIEDIEPSTYITSYTKNELPTGAEKFIVDEDASRMKLNEKQLAEYAKVNELVKYGLKNKAATDEISILKSLPGAAVFFAVDDGAKITELFNTWVSERIDYLLGMLEDARQEDIPYRRIDSDVKREISRTTAPIFWNERVVGNNSLEAEAMQEITFKAIQEVQVGLSVDNATATSYVSKFNKDDLIDLVTGKSTVSDLEQKYNLRTEE